MAQGTHESIEDFDHGNHNIEFHHGLPTNPMVKFADTDGHQNILIDGVDNADLDQLIGVSESKNQKQGVANQR